MGFNTYKVGTVEVVKPVEVTQSYECAAWHQTILVEPGTFDLYASTLWGERHVHGGSFYASVSGKVVSANFTSRLGAHYGSNSAGEKVMGTIQTGTLHAGMAYGTLGEVGEPTAEGVIAFPERGVIVRLNMAVLVRHEWMPEKRPSDTREPRRMWSLWVHPTATPEPRRERY